MSKTEEKIDEIETLAEAIVEEEETMKNDGGFTKFKRGVKKHSKKIIIGGLIGVAALLGYKQGKKLSEFEEDFDYDTDDIVDASSEVSAVTDEN